MRIKPMRLVKQAILFLCCRVPATLGTGRNSARYKHAGFNLLELLIALSLVGTLAMIAYPSYFDEHRWLRSGVRDCVECFKRDINGASSGNCYILISQGNKAFTGNEKPVLQSVLITPQRQALAGC